MRFTSRLAVLVLSAPITLIPGAASAGDVVIADAYASYFQRGSVKFDGVQNVLIAYRRSFDRSDPALARPVDQRAAPVGHVFLQPQAVR